MGRITVKEKKKMEILGLTIDARGNWSRHIQAIASDARKRLGAIRRMSHMLDDKSIMRAYKAFVRSKIEYGSLAYWGAAESHLKKLDRIQESAVALLRNPDPSTPFTGKYKRKSCHWIYLQAARRARAWYDDDDDDDYGLFQVAWLAP